MHEAQDQNGMAKTQWKAPHYGAGAAVLCVGLLAGRAFFPLEIPTPFVVEKEKRVEVPVDRIVEKIVEIPVEKVLERRVDVPATKIVYVDRVLAVSPALSSWRQLSKGMSPGQVRSILGEPAKISGGYFEHWYYNKSGNYKEGSATFVDSQLDSWHEP